MDEALTVPASAPGGEAAASWRQKAGFLLVALAVLARGGSGGDVHALALSLVGALALGVVLVYFWRTPARDQLLLVALALVLGGAIGNLTDRVAGGAVTDF